MLSARSFLSFRDSKLPSIGIKAATIDLSMYFAEDVWNMCGLPTRSWSVPCQNKEKLAEIRTNVSRARTRNVGRSLFVPSVAKNNGQLIPSNYSRKMHVRNQKHTEHTKSHRGKLRSKNLLAGRQIGVSLKARYLTDGL